MIWDVVILSQYKELEWAHTETCSCLKLTAQISLTESEYKLDIYLSFFSCVEMIDSVSLLEANVQKRHSSVGIFLPEKKIQLKLLNSAHADDMVKKLHYAKMMFLLSTGLLAISLKYNPRDTLFS